MAIQPHIQILTGTDHVSPKWDNLWIPPRAPYDPSNTSDTTAPLNVRGLWVFTSIWMGLAYDWNQKKYFYIRIEGHGSMGQDSIMDLRFCIKVGLQMCSTWSFVRDIRIGALLLSVYMHVRRHCWTMECQLGKILRLLLTICSGIV